MTPYLDEWILSEAHNIASWAVHEAGVGADESDQETLIAELAKNIAHFARSIASFPPSGS